MNVRCPGVAAVALCLTLALSAPAPAEPPASDPDEAVLRVAGVGTDNDALLRFLRTRSHPGADLEGIRRLVRQLDSDEFALREKASQELVAIGRTARAALREAARSSIREVADRARACLDRIGQNTGLLLPNAVVRLLVRRRAAGAVEALLGYLPGAADPDLEEEIVYGLDALALDNGKVRPALVRALRDKATTRRAAAACIVGRRGTPEEQEAVRKLLADPEPLVRLRAAQGLLAAKEAIRDPLRKSTGEQGGEVLRALVALLAEPSAEVAWQAEELLRWAVGEAAPAETLGAPGSEQAKRCRAAWEVWLRSPLPRPLDLGSLDHDRRRPGLQLWCVGPLSEDGQAALSNVWLVGCDGRPRWELPGIKVADAQLLPGNRLLLAERIGVGVTERDLHGKLLWRVRLWYETRNQVNTVRRLPNGNTFFNSNEADPDGKQVYPTPQLSLPAPSTSPRKLANGRVAYVSEYDNRIYECDLRAGREVRRIQLEAKVGGYPELDPLPNGHFLIRSLYPKGLQEVNAAGKVVWRYNKPGVWFTSAARLRNGNTLVALYHSCGWENGVVEIEPAGRKVWEAYFDRYPVRAVKRIRVCLGLVRLGFDGPRPPWVDLGSVSSRALGLRDRNPLVRCHAAYSLIELGPKAAPAIPDLLAALGEADPNSWEVVRDALVAIGPAAIDPLLALLKDKNPYARARALYALTTLQVKGDTAVRAYLAALKDKDAEVRAMAARALHAREVDAGRAIPALTEALRDPAPRVQFFAARSLESFGPKAKPAIPVLLEVARGKDADARDSAVMALAVIAPGDKEVVAALAELLTGGDIEATLSAASALLKMGPGAKAAIPALRAALKRAQGVDSQAAHYLRSSATQALVKAGADAEVVIPALIELFQDVKAPGRSREWSAETLAGYGPKAKAAVPVLTAALRDRSSTTTVVKAAKEALALIQPEK